MSPAMDAYWDKARREWDDRSRRKPEGYTSAALTREEHEAQGRADSALIAELLARAGARWGTGFEIGCGNGRLLKHLAPRFGRLHGGDISAEMIEQARRDAPGATCHVMGGPELPCGDLDVVYCYRVFHHVPRSVFRDYVKAARHALAPGGVFLFHLNRANNLRRKLKALVRYEPGPDEAWKSRFYTRGELRKLAAAEGFDVLDEHRAGRDWVHVWRAPAPSRPGRD